LRGPESTEISTERATCFIEFESHPIRQEAGNIAWAAKEVLRRHLGPKFDRRLPLFLAKAILERMRLTKWCISKEPPDPPHSTPGE
jgi:hypothetical protein